MMKTQYKFGALILLTATGCGELFQEAQTFNSYRYDARLESKGLSLPIRLNQTGVVETDRSYASATTQFGPIEMNSETIRIGDARWVRGDIPFIDALGPRRTQDPMIAGTQRDVLAQALAGRPGVAEMINGAPVTRYTLRGEELLKIVRTTIEVKNNADPPEVTIWVSDALGVPVRMVANMAVADEPGTLRLEVNVTHINDPTLVIAPSTRVSPLRAVQTETAEVGLFDRLKAGLGAAIGVLSGVDPFSVEEAVGIVEESSQGLAETKENAEAYFDAYPEAEDRARYTLAEEDLSDKNPVYVWFWSFFE